MYYQFNSDIVPDSQQVFIKELLNCKNFDNSDRLLGLSKGRGTTWFLYTQDKLGVNVVLRHYYRGGLFGKFVKDRYLFKTLNKTRALQEFDLLTQMRAWNLPVPRPIAVKIQRSPLCYQADILLEKIADTQDLSQLLQLQPLTNEDYQQIGQLIRQLHDHQVHHSDLNIHNILREKESGKFWLIDFDKCQIQAGQEWKQANLARLLRSFNKEQERLHIYFNSENWQALEQGYYR
ncbi:3-deoxy-D-manno-octulosonic acid kinase [Bibersteinia trehalosi]|uniref:3-deoxy-D-manno-octulosonic acid kinase n=1 Tax=Bibersteinia trehalosi TaxID=47735 RepID=A0A3R8MFP7_BIBTR|nr:3-deoxy-D-manno-octulosonic acid kinase [Bibersteinia trehalosi]RRN04722.1 3-deoxy-D-manno-octulosonic acid kinase [Bibersteinia trehalosi]